MSVELASSAKENEVRDLIIGLAKRQYAKTGRVNITEIQERLFGQHGGGYYHLVAREVDAIGLPRLKHKRTRTIRSVVTTDADATIKTLWFAPHVVTIDPQGIQGGSQ